MNSIVKLTLFYFFLSCNSVILLCIYFILSFYVFFSVVLPLILDRNKTTMLIFVLFYYIVHNRIFLIG